MDATWTGSTSQAMKTNHIVSSRHKRSPRSSYERWNTPVNYMKKPEETPDDVSDRIVMPLAHWIKSHGFISELFERVNMRVSTNIPRAMMMTWIHNDPARRVYPSYGYGKVLVDSMRRIKAEYQASITPENFDDAVIKAMAKDFASGDDDDDLDLG